MKAKRFCATPTSSAISRPGLKNVLDRAVLKYKELHKELGIEKYKMVDEIPFDFSRRMMSVAIEGPDGERQLLTKGAPEAVFAKCTHFESEGEIFPMEPILVGDLVAASQ